MMHTTLMTPAEIQSRGLEALARELGPVEYVRFLQQITSGRGDYAKDRHNWLDRLTECELRKGIARLQKKRTRK